MPSIKITIKDTASPAFKQFVREMPEALKKGLKRSMVLYEGIVIGRYMTNAGVGAGPRKKGQAGPLRIVSGRLARAVSARPGSGGRNTLKDEGTTLSITKSIDTRQVPYAGIHEYGGTITAKGGGYLRFKTATGFATVKSVRIPARPYLRPALEDVKEPARDAIIDEINKIAQEAATA